RRAPAPGRRVFQDQRPAATRLLADVFENDDPCSLLCRVICAAGVRRPDLATGLGASHSPRVVSGRNRIQYSARRRAPSLLELLLGQQADGDDDGCAWRQFVPLALEACRLPSLLCQYRGP